MTKKKPEEMTQRERAFGMLKKKKKKVTELDSVQKPLVQLYEIHIKSRFPDSILITNPLSDTYFTSETITTRTGGKISKNAIIMNKAKAAGFRRAQPDILIIQKYGQYNGLALELKREGEKVYRKDGQLRKDEHLKEQEDYLKLLRAQGFVAEFACGLDEAIQKINKYFNLDMNIN